MKVAWIQWGGAAAAAVLVLLMSAPVQAADTGAWHDGGCRRGTRPAQQAGRKRHKANQKGMSDSAVRVLMTYAFSIIPKRGPGPDGKTVKIDKSDPNKYPHSDR